MSELNTTSESKDTSPLDPDQLSEQELIAIFEIESRIAAAKDTGLIGDPKGVDLYLKTVHPRHPRVLLLDGGRGTGKTSLLLTMVRRWHHLISNDENGARTLAAAYDRRVNNMSNKGRARIESLPNRSADERILTDVQVLPILDFDPLPPGMPLLAAIVQAWKSLAEVYDEPWDDCIEETDDYRSLTDRWHGLFRMAAAGWGTVSQEKSLIEQVLDRQDQVQHWQRLSEDWNVFVNEVFKRGWARKDRGVLSSKSVFVIMIDDCDLQVGRIRELLPALRTLYHPRVFFIVAADRRHMVDMLKLDYYGQQSGLAKHKNANPDPLWDLVNNDPWASELAYSSVDKVFPKASQWKLDRLSILDFLAFPGPITDLPDDLPVEDVGLERGQAGSNFYTFLNAFKRQPRSGTPDSSSNILPSGLGAGDLILQLARTTRSLLPGVMTYRAAQQLRHHVMRYSGEERAAEILARLVSENGDEYQAVVRSHGPATMIDSDIPGPERQPGTTGERYSVEVQTAGEIAASYRPGLRVPAGTYEMVMSTRPDFVFRRISDNDHGWMHADFTNRFFFSGGLIAKMLEEADFPIDAIGLRWDTYLSHAWTEWLLTPKLSFAWNRFKHPRPDELFRQTDEWAGLVEQLREPKNSWRVERCAYAWVYYQRKWAGQPAVSNAKKPEELRGSSKRWPWLALLDFSNIADEEDRNRWKHRTMPLLGRPELGFPPDIQKKFLEGLVGAPASVYQDLLEERRRLVADAVIATHIQLGEYEVSVPPEDEVTALLKKLDEIYEASYLKRSHLKRNHWKDIVENRVRKQRGVTSGSTRRRRVDTSLSPTKREPVGPA